MKPSPDAEAEGPLSAIEVKRRAAAEELSRDALISTDGATWHPAGRVKGLFPQATPAQLADPLFEQPVTASQPPAGRARAPRPRHGGLPPAYPGTAPMFQRPTVAPAPAFTPPAEPIGETPAPPVPEASSNGDAAVAHEEPDVPAVGSAPPPLPAIKPPPRAPLPASLPYATPGVTGAARILPRRTNAFLIVSLFMLVAGLVHAYEFYVMATTRHPRDLDLFIALGANFAWVGLGLAALILWINWLGGVHKDMRVLTARQYPVRPGQAVGFFFIPVFNAFWAVFAPAKLAAALNQQLEGNGLPLVSRGTVVVCQIVSVIAPFVGLWGLTPVMYAISMRTIQSGFNRLVGAQYA